MNYIQIPKEAFDFICELRLKYSEYSNIFDNIETSLNLRLWNQLSEDLILLSNKEELQRSQDLVFLYNSLIISVERAFNPMKLILIVQNVIRNFSGKDNNNTL